MARSEVLPAIFAMADAHQTFSHRDVRRVFVGDVAPHDVVADRPTDRPTDRSAVACRPLRRTEEGVPILRPSTSIGAL